MVESPTHVLVEFVTALRAAGLSIGIGQSESLLRATGFVDPGRRDDLYWAGRLTLVNRRSDLPAYDRIFAATFFAGPLEPSSERRAGDVTAAQHPPMSVLQAESELDDGSTSDTGPVASGLEILRQKDFATCDEAELHAIHQLLHELRLHPPTRTSRRSTAARTGPNADIRRTVRTSMSHLGETLELFRRDRSIRPRRIVLLLDVSGSMRSYSRSLLQFGHVLARSSNQVEVFCFGTRLTRITDAARLRDPSAALARAAERVLDWEGGTLIGTAMTSFLNGSASGGLVRGSVIIICSDGLDRGDPAVLGRSMARMHRLAHRVIWVTPLMRDARYEPIQRGMVAARLGVDDLQAGHNLASLQELARLVRSL